MAKVKSEILYRFQNTSTIYSLFNISFSSDKDDFYFGSNHFKNFHFSFHKDNSIWISPNKNYGIKKEILFQKSNIKEKSFTIVLLPGKIRKRKIWTEKKGNRINMLFRFSSKDLVENIAIIFHITHSKERVLESKLIEEAKTYPKNDGILSDENRINLGKYFLESSIQGLRRLGLEESIETVIIFPPGVDPNSVYKNLKKISLEKKYIDSLISGKFDYLIVRFEKLYVMILYLSELIEELGK